MRHVLCLLGLHIGPPCLTDRVSGVRCRACPPAAQVLAGPWYFDRKGEVPHGKLPFMEIPVFNYHAGYLSVNFSSNYFLLSQRHPEVPRLTPAHLEAIELFESLASSDALRMDYVLQPGEIQLLSNHTCLHARSGFTDHPVRRGLAGSSAPLSLC